MSAEWLHWYYLIYALPAVVAVLVLLMTGIGGHHGGHSHAAHRGLGLHGHPGGIHETSAAGHAPHPAGTHPGAHTAPAHEARVGPGAPGSHHGQPEVRSAPGVGQQLLGFIGIGRAPLTIVLGSLLIGWGLFGMAVTDFLQHGLHLPPVLFVAPSLAVAAVGALLFARLFGELAARLMPQDESYAIPREGLLGQTGKVVYPVSATGGRVHVYDQFRTLHVSFARAAPGQPAIEKGAEVIIASIDPDHGYLIVEPLGFSRSRVASQPLAENVNEPQELRNREN